MSDQDYRNRMAYELSHRTLAQVVTESGFFILIAIVGFFGNSCVLYVFYKSSRLRSVTNYYLIVLAISDITMTTVVMPLTTAVAITGRDVLGATAGQIIGFFTYAVVFGSLQTTSLIAVNRFFCITKPSIYRKYFKPRPATIMIIGAWLFSILNTALVYGSGMGTYVFHPESYVYILSYNNHVTRRVSAALNQLFFGLLPMILTIACYWKVYHVVKRHNATVSVNLSTAGTLGNSTTMNKEEIHITKSVLALVIGFVLCWLPCGIIYHIAAYMNLPRYASMSITYLSYSSSAINPFLFYAFNNPFKREFVAIFFPRRRAQVGVEEERKSDRRRQNANLDIGASNIVEEVETM